MLYSCQSLLPTESETNKNVGEGNIEIKLVGDTYDDCAIAAKKYTEENGMTFIPPFDDHRIIEGQGTVGVEILEELNRCRLFICPGWWRWIMCRRWFLFQNLFSQNKNHWT